MRVRRRRLPLIAAAAVFLLLLMGVYGAQASSGKSAKTVQIAVFGYNTTPYALANRKAAEAAAKQYGAKITFFNPNSDAQLQATQIQDAITTGKYQAFWISANDGHRLQPLVKQAAAKGIKVGVSDQTLGGTGEQVTLQTKPGVTITIGTGLKTQAVTGIAEIKAACAAQVGAGKPCSVALMAGFDNFPPDVYRYGYITKALKKTGITTKFMPQGQYAAPGAQKSTLDFFQSKPKVDVIYTSADQMIAGVLVALSQLHITPGKDVKLIGFGATTEAIAGIKAGTWYASLGLYPSTSARLGVKYLVDAVNGKTVPKLIDVYKLPGSLPVIDAAILKSHASFKADWSYG